MLHAAKRTILLILPIALLWCAALQTTSLANEQGNKPEPLGSAAKSSLEPQRREQYCSNIASVAAAGKIARQEAQLREIEGLVKRRRDELESKRQELQQLVDRHEALARKASEMLIKIYSRMKPDAAAAQIVNLDDELAASLLLQLNAKNSSAILNEMSAWRGGTFIKKIAAISSLASAGKSR